MPRDRREFVDVACPHCLGQSGSCCVCEGSRRVPIGPRLDAAVGFAWHRAGCVCDACGRAGYPPLGDATAHHRRHARVFGAFETCQHTACAAERRRYALAS